MIQICYFTSWNIFIQTFYCKCSVFTHYTNKFLKNTLPPSIKANLLWEEGCATVSVWICFSQCQLSPTVLPSILLFYNYHKLLSCQNKLKLPDVFLGSWKDYILILQNSWSLDFWTVLRIHYRPSVAFIIIASHPSLYLNQNHVINCECKIDNYPIYQRTI